MDDSKVKKKKIFYPFLFAFFSAMNFRGSGILDLSQDFLQKFLELTVLSQFAKEKLILKNERGLNLEKFEKLAEISQMKGPKFVFVHLLLPYHPFMFGSGGEPLEDTSDRSNQDKKYLDQLEFTNTKILWLVDELIKKSPRPPVIMLQSDEEPAGEERPVEKIARFDSKDQAVVRMRIRCHILNAYYFPAVETMPLYKSFSHVNTFRVLFNLYLRTKFPLLPNRTYRPASNTKVVRKLDLLPEWVWTIKLKQLYK
jgi:hypothetical protein